MSAQSVTRLCNQFVAKQEFAPVTERSLRSALALASPPIIQLQYELALYSGLSHEQSCARALPILLQNCAIHLADDIADGDCDYLSLPQAATALYTLQQLTSLSLSELNLAESQVFLRLLVQVGDAQHQEIATERWDLQKARSAALGLNGAQFSAYFYLASAGTNHAGKLRDLGCSFGIVNHLANDMKSHDARVMTLPEEEQTKLLEWGLEHAQTVIEAKIPLLTAQLSPLLRYLR